MTGARRRATVCLTALALSGCGLLGGGDDDPSSRLVAVTDSIGIAWVASGLYSLDTANGAAYAGLQRVDVETGAATAIPWPDEPCKDPFRSGPYPGADGQVYISQVCNYIGVDATREGSYLAYDPAAGTWSTLTPRTWEDPSHGLLSWNAEAQEGLFTSPDLSCSTLYRLTAEGPSLIEQVVPTPDGDVDLQAGVPLDDRDGCLRDGRVIGATANRQGQVAVLVSPVRGPAGPGRLSSEFALVLATWTPGRAEPLSDFRTLAEGIDAYSDPAWTPDGSAVVYSEDGDRITRVDIASGQRTKIADEGASQVEVSPDGTMLALRHAPDTDENVQTQIRVLRLDGAAPQGR